VSDRLILFTRYPQPGKAKTRLIDALGESGAATLSQQMTEHTLAQVNQLQARHSVSVEIRFADGSVSLMQQWLGETWVYIPQGEGDLGDRLIRALESAFQSGSERIVIIGSDCPELDASLLQQAFTHLRQHDLVIGPAIDGGYYLIGLRRFVPELLTGITWSTSQVFAQTLKIAVELNLSIAQLPTLSDVDYPQDLEIWQRVRSRNA